MLGDRRASQTLHLEDCSPRILYLDRARVRVMVNARARVRDRVRFGPKSRASPRSVQCHDIYQRVCVY